MICNLFGFEIVILIACSLDFVSPIYPAYVYDLKFVSKDID